jgi:hypothetical protein
MSTMSRMVPTLIVGIHVDSMNSSRKYGAYGADGAVTPAPGDKTHPFVFRFFSLCLHRKELRKLNHCVNSL